MYNTTIENEELQYFKGLTVPNFTIKLSDIRHKTSNTYDNKLFKIEDITNTIFRIVPQFYCETITGTNPNDIILDDQCIIAHLEDEETYFTFIGDTNNNDIQDYQSYTTYYSIGDSLTTNQFNQIVSLLRNSIIHNDAIRINETVDGIYGKYEFDIDDCTFLDTGMLITDETISAEPKVKLTDNVFRWSTYTLQLKVFHYTGVNILDDIDPSDLKVVDTVEVELTPNTWVDIPVDDLEENYIISFDTNVAITHDKTEIHAITGIEAYSTPQIIQNTETSEVYAQILDTDGRPYNINDASGKTVYFFEKLEISITLVGTQSIIETSDTVDLSATVKDEDGSRLVGKTVYFYSSPHVDPEPEPTNVLELSSSKDVLSYYNSESATLTATYTEDGTPTSGETVTMKVYDSTETTLLDTLTVTDVGDGTYTATYDSSGVGDVVVVAECGLLQETYELEDLWYYNTNTYSTTTTQLNVTLPSVPFTLEYIIKQTDTSKSVPYLDIGDASNNRILVGQYARAGSNGLIIYKSSSTTHAYGTNTTVNADNTVWFKADGTKYYYKLNNGSVMEVNDANVTLSKLIHVESGAGGTLKNIKVKAL